MGRIDRRKLALRRETVRRLADGELGRVAGGYAARCTYEKSGCHVQDTVTDGCITQGCTDCCETKGCEI